MCDSEGTAHLSLKRGLIASIIAAESQDDDGCGTARCPWVIEVQPGRVINLTLLDYGPAIDVDVDARPPSLAYPSSESQCTGPRYAVVKERANPRETLVCGGGGGVNAPAVKHVYTSISNQLEISVTGRQVLDWRAQFVIQYEGTTVPPLPPTEDAVYCYAGITCQCSTVRETKSLPTFRRHLKTFYFKSAHSLSAAHLA